MADEVARAGDGRTGADQPARRLELEDLPPAVAERLRFENAAPKRFRREKLPPEVRDELKRLWESVAADVYDEVAGMTRRGALRKEALTRVLARIADRFAEAERALIVTGVYYPLPFTKERSHTTAAGAGAAASALVEELAPLSATVGATVAILSAVVGQAFETYVAASARTHKYEAAQRSPDPMVVLLDLAEANGYGEAQDQRANRDLVIRAATSLSRSLSKRTMSKFARSLVPAAGIGANAVLSSLAVRRATNMPLRPFNEEELQRLAHDLLRDTDGYRSWQQGFRELDT